MPRAAVNRMPPDESHCRLSFMLSGLHSIQVGPNLICAEPIQWRLRQQEDWC
jgi:hypothetical protein